nr:allophanate hydrolase subunit 2 family protein [Streptomyces sp. SID4944]
MTSVRPDGLLHVVRPGALTTVQDTGRPGWAHLGVGRAGALDAPAARLANRLVGNAPGAALLETTITGCAVRP